MKISTKWLKENIPTGSTWSMRNGIYTVRQSYFYRPYKVDHVQYGEKVKTMIEKAIPNCLVTIQETANIFKPFIGGAPVRDQSHYFVKFTIERK